MSIAADAETLDYDFVTPSTNGTSTSGEPTQEIRRNTARRVSFGEIAAEYLKSLSPQEPSPHSTPTQSGGPKIDADSPYTDVTDDMIARMLSQERDQPSVESIIGGSSQATELKGLPYLISQFLPLKTYAKQLEKWNKGNSTISALAESYADKRPTVMDQIVEATNYTGLQARELIAKAKQMIAHHESDTTEIVILYFMIYIWATHIKSTKRDIILCAIQDYALASDQNEVQHLLQASAQGQCLNRHHATPIHADVRSFPGCKRLDPQYSFPTLLQHYRDLFIICVNTMTWELESKTDMGFLEKSIESFPLNEHTWADHPLSQKGTSVAEQNAIILTTHRALLTQCHKAGCSARAPTEHACMLNLLNCLDDPTFHQVRKIISEEDRKPMCYKDILLIVQRADRRVRHQTPIITQSVLMRANIKSRHAVNSPSEPASKKPGSDKEKFVPDTKLPPTKDSEETPLTPQEYEAKLTSLAALYAAQPALEKRKQIVFGPHLYYEHPHGAYVLRSSLFSLLREKNICTCCGDCDPLFPSHNWKECPYMPYRKSPHNADTPPVLALSSETKQLSSFPVHVAFNGSYPGRTSLANPGTSGGTPLPPSVEAPVPALRHMNSYHALVHHESSPAPSGHIRYEI